MANGVVRTDNLTGIYDGSKLAAVKFYDGAKYAEIENGMVVSLDEYLGGDVYKAVKPSAGQKLGKLALVAGVELFKDYNRPLDEWINPADEAVRVYVLHQGDVFSVTEPCLNGAPDKETNKYLAVEAQTKWKVASAEDGAVAELIAIESVGEYVYYVYRVL